MATITEDYVSFETAKLLKEKGFDVPCRCFMSMSQGFKTYCSDSLNFNNKRECGRISCPTIQMAMKWLREIQNLQIQIAPINSRYKNWAFGIYKDFSPLTIELICYPTYEEACETAIKYCLEKLI